MSGCARSSLGAGGYALQAVLFYLALRHGSAGTVAMLFYVYPAIVVLIEVVIGRVRPTRSSSCPCSSRAPVRPGW